MSIFGPCSPSGASDTTGQEGVDLSQYAKKKRVSRLVNDAVASRVAKTGDTLTGDLSLGGNKIRGLPTIYPPVDYQGDEAVSWNQVVGLVDDADVSSSSRVGPSCKPLIAVWAEENGALDGGYEWSFGNGSHEHAGLGYPMPTPGRVKSMTLCITPESAAARVSLVVNGRDVPGCVVSKSASQRVGIVSWAEAYELAPGDTVNFKTIQSNDVRASGAIVSALIELDVD